MTEPRSDESLAAIAELLLGVAYADGRFQVVEAEQIREILSEFTDIAELPEGVVGAIHGFDEGAFDLGRAAARLGPLDADDRRALLAMILRVVDADAVRDRDEEHFFHAVARAIGAFDEDVAAVLGG